MVDVNVINKEILDLEAKDTSYAVIERLSWLYTVREHLASTESPKTSGRLVGSEFIEVCSNKPIQSLLDVLDEHFSAIQVLYPKEYNVIIEKIKNI